MVFQEEMVVLL